MNSDVPDPSSSRGNPSTGAGQALSGLIERTFRAEHGRVLAALISRLSDFELAEDALHDAFTAAVEKWPRDGVPANPRAWLVSAGRFRAIDRIRRRARFDASVGEVADRIEESARAHAADELEDFKDDRLRLIFTCCHPALPPEAQMALTLREVCGLTTEEVARAFLTRPTAVAQRIVRAKRKIRDARIPYEIPERPDLPERLGSVLHVVYLLFNEGYSATSGDTLTRPDLSGEAIHLGRLLLELLPEPEVMGLLALMLIQESRRAARTTAEGDIIVLEEQDRTLWDRALIAEGTSLVERAFASREIGPYTVQAAIAALHAEATDAASTDWRQIVALYDALVQAGPSPVVELNRAVAIAMRDGPAAGLTLIEGIRDRGDLEDYHLLHATRAELCRRLGRTADARAAFRRALELARLEPERRFLTRRLQELDA